MTANGGRVLLAYDGSENAGRAIAVAGELLGPRPALVLHLWESWAAEAPALAGTSAAVHGMAAELDAIADQQSREHATHGAELATRAGFEAEAVSERARGPIWRSLLDVAGEQDCAAIVVGSRGLSGISRMLGSVSNGVVHHSRRPVLVVPGEGHR